MKSTSRPARFPSVVALPAAVLAALLMTACASSERMNRLAWDSDSYSAPKASRIKGGRYDEAVVNLRTPVGLKDRQVNIWPFCTVNSRYVSILWPFIDWDDFGMAVRPFYNKEGNDASILFPLSSWNTQDGEGWALNAYWDPDYYGMFPFFHVGREPGAFWFAGPFVGGGNRFGFIPLCYVGEELRFVGPVWWLKPEDDVNSSFGFFPLFWKIEDASALLPLYLHVPENLFLSPVLSMVNSDGGNGWRAGSYAFLGYWGDHWKTHGFFPFYRIKQQNGSFNHILLWWWEHGRDNRNCGLFPFAWMDEDGGIIIPFGGWKRIKAVRVDGSEEEWTRGNILLLGYWGKDAVGVFPFFRASSDEKDMKYAGPVWWAYDEDDREFGVFPFYRREYRNAEAVLDYLFPAYYWERDEYGSMLQTIPYARKDYTYPEHRTTTSIHARRYLIYDTYGKRGNRFNGLHDRDDFMPAWGYSASFLDDMKSRMKEKDLTAEEAEIELSGEVASKWESKTTALHPFFEWTSSTEGQRDLRLLGYLFGFDRDKDSSLTWLLWHILYSSGTETYRDYYGQEHTSSRVNILGAMPFWNQERRLEDNGPATSSITVGGNFVSDCVQLLLKRALIEDGSEEAKEWHEDLLTDFTGKRILPGAAPVSPAPGASPMASLAPDSVSDSPNSPDMKTANVKFRTLVSNLPNETVFRILGIDRALSGEMTAKEAEATAKRLIDAMLTAHKADGTHVETDYGFVPLFLATDEKREKENGETELLRRDVLTPLTFSSTEDGEFTFKVLAGLLGHYTTFETPEKSRTICLATRKRSFSLLALIRSSMESYPIHNDNNNGAFISLVHLVHNKPDTDDPLLNELWNARLAALADRAIEEQAGRPAIADGIRRYRDGARTAADNEAFLADAEQWEKYYFWTGDSVRSSSGFYPFFFWSNNYTDRGGERSHVSKSWFVLPLLSGGTSSDSGSSLGILCPLIYYGATRKQPDGQIIQPGQIIAPSANALQASHTGMPVSGETDHYALFLVGASRETFLQWKPEAGSFVPQLYQALYELIAYDVRRTPMDLFNEDAMLKDKPDAHVHRQYAILRRVNELLEKLGMETLDKARPISETVVPMMKSLVEQYTQTRTVNGFNSGSSLLSSSFSCEETGDYQTKVLFGLGANSQKLGAKEHRSILGYLYNMDTDGVNTRKFIFPFITTKDAPGFHEWSFLGGLFERSEEDGKTGGRIFFFPYGNRPGRQ